MKEVADRAGVAISSVSRVLNDHPDVSDAMRARVLAATRALGYEPDLLAQSLRRGSTKTVGFVVRDISNPLFADIVRGSETVLRSSGYSVILTNSDGDPSLDALHIQLLSRRRVDGLILSLESETHAPTLAALRRATGALVLVDREVAAVGASTVLSNHYMGVRAAVLDMLRVDDSRVAYLGGPEGVRASRERLRGYLDAHEAARRTILEDELIRSGSYLEDFGYEETVELLKSPRRPTGILAGGAQLSSGALVALHDHGVEIGGELDLVCCDGIPLMRTFTPPLNVVERDAIALGSKAAELLLQMLLDNAPAQVVSLPTRYVRRSSVRSATGKRSALD